MINKSKNNILSLIIKSLFLSIGGMIFPVLYIFIPAMFVVESVYSGIVKIFSFFMGVCLLVGLLMSPIIGVMMFVVFGPIILTFHYMISNKYSVNTTIIVTSIIFFISLIIGLYWVGFTPEVINSPESVKSFIEVERNLMSSMGEKVELSNAYLTQVYNLTIQIIPSVLIIISLIVSYCTYSIVGKSILKRGGIILQPSSFIFFRVPKGLPLALFISMFLIYILKGTIGSIYSIMMMNIVLIFSFILFVLGFSVLMYLLNKLKFGGILKFVIYVSVFIIPFFQIALIFLGLLDYLFNFRKLPN